MKPVGVVIVDSKDRPWATETAIRLYTDTKARIYLVNVQPRYPSHIARFFSAGLLKRFHLEDGRQFLAPVASELDKAGVPHRDHVLIGRTSEQILEFGRAYHCEVMIRERLDTLLTRLGVALAASSGWREILGLLNGEPPS